MKKFKFFIYIIIFCISQTVYSQIDSVGFTINHKIPSRAVFCSGYYFSNTDTIKFLVSDTSNYTFSWTFDKGEANEIVLSDTLPVTNHWFNQLGEHSVLFEVTENSSGTTFPKEKTRVLQPVLEVPNVFTPNGDGINDLFIIKASGIVEYNISIFGRSGILIYEQTAPIITWDGRNTSGNEVSDGTFFYILTALDNSIEAQKGTIQLYR
ncbi:MAG: gliding motility-associated C-terminal domain-containing protein [Bacteroidota bacterium]|nr:gliding motility-associated C-terminal domain-containing protein [Bacteroidota bacterium]